MKYLAALVLMAASSAHAADISVVGLFPNKAVLVIDGRSPKTYTVGTSIGPGMKLLAADGGSATVEVDGRRQTIMLGGHVNRQTGDRRASVTLPADTQGHFMVQGQINGGSVRMLVDTGATMVAIPAMEARRLNIDYKRGRTGYVNTANGVAPAYMVKLDRIKIGDIELHQVDAVVQEQGLDIVLLGMSFLNRTEMRREGQQMVLTRRF